MTESSGVCKLRWDKQLSCRVRSTTRSEVKVVEVEGYQRMKGAELYQPSPWTIAHAQYTGNRHIKEGLYSAILTITDQFFSSVFQGQSIA